MDLTYMVMKQINSKVAQDMAYGQRALIVTTPDADMKENKDYILAGGFGIAYRRRPYPIRKNK